jgi:hypothetical protein
MDFYLLWSDSLPHLIHSILSPLGIVNSTNNSTKNNCMSTSLRSNAINSVFLTIIAILLFMSMLGLIEIHWRLASDYNFSFTPEGINKYISSLGSYKELFVGTVAAIAAFLGLHRLHAATQANIDKIRQDKFSDWKTVLDIRFTEIETRDRVMKREFVRLRYRFFQDLYDIKFNIESKQTLDRIANSVFGDIILFFEENNDRYLQMGGIYGDHSSSYSYDSFRFLFTGSCDTLYDGAQSDLFNWYVSKLDSNRLVDANMHHQQQQNNLRR